MLKKTIFIFFSLFVFVVKAQNPDPVASQELVLDSLLVNQDDERVYADSLLTANRNTENETYPKKFQDNFRKKYQKPDFNYTTQKKPKSTKNQWIAKIIHWLSGFLGERNPAKTITYATTILWGFTLVIIGIVLYFLVKFLLSKNGNLFFSRRNKKIKIKTQDGEENIHELNFSQIITKYEHNSDFRSAIRYQFLQVLKTASDKKIIAWNTDKTNRDYVHQLSNTKYQNTFKNLVRIFDNVWYGEFEVDEKDYETYKNTFQDFIKFLR